MVRMASMRRPSSSPGAYPSISASVALAAVRMPSSAKEKNPAGARSSSGSRARSRTPAASLTPRAPGAGTRGSARWSRRGGSCAGSGRWPSSPAACSPASWRCTYSPTSSGATMSSEHCRMSEGTVTRGRSSRLSERKVASAKRRATTRVGGAEALGELLAQLGAVGVLDDGRRQEVGPADVVVLHHVQQPLDVAALEAAHVRRVVHVARRGADHHQPLEAFRLAVGGEHAHHGAHRVAHETTSRRSSACTTSSTSCA
jgi:hypothetical protein